MRFLALCVLGLSPLIWLSVRADAHQTLRAQPSLRVLHTTDHHRRSTWHCQSHLGKPRTRTVYSDKRSSSVPYRVWVRDLWAKRAKLYCSAAQQLSSPRAAICYVFGSYCSQAISVASCETGGTFWVGASNGQYLGIFQMGSWERATYGHGSTPLEQARAAYRYFAASGYDWSPWECKP